MKHHALHVIGLNKALKQLHAARETNDFKNIQALTRAMTAHAAGHVNHTCYFAGMAPVRRGGGTKPAGELARRIDRDFGSYEKFKAQFTAAALSIDGNGWAVLAYNPEPLDRLFILQLTQEQDCASLGMMPVTMMTKTGTISANSTPAAPLSDVWQAAARSRPRHNSRRDHTPQHAEADLELTSGWILDISSP